MILADENISFSIILSIRNLGIEVFSIAESKSGISDREVIQLSLNPPRIILTEDKDFGEWVFAHKVTNVSVLFLRYEYGESAEIVQVLTKLLEERIDDLFHKFTTVTPRKIRIRSL